MHDHPKGGKDDPAFITTHDEDEREEAAILRRVLELDPAALTLDELVRDLTGGGSRDFRYREKGWRVSVGRGSSTHLGW